MMPVMSLSTMSRPSALLDNIDKLCRFTQIGENGTRLHGS